MITPLPDPPTRDDPTGFAAKADAFMVALPTFVTEANATAQDCVDEAAAAAASAAAALVSEDNAYTSGLLAQGSANFQGDWNSGTAYTIGQTVYNTANTTRYVARTNNTNKAPHTNPSDWLALTAVGTITGVTAGTLMTGGGSSGSVTINGDKATFGTAGTHWWANTANKILSADGLDEFGKDVSVGTLSSSLTLNFANGRNFSGTIGTVNCSLSNTLTNGRVGMSGIITIVQHASAAKTFSLGSNWKPVGSYSAISSSPSSKNVFSYWIRTLTEVQIVFLGSYA